MGDIQLRVRFVHALIGAVVASTVGLVSGCVAQTANLQVVKTGDLRLTAVPLRPLTPVVPPTDELSDAPAPRAKERVEPAVSVPFDLEIFAGPTQTRIDSRTGPTSAQSATTDLPAAASSRAGNVQPEPTDGFRRGGAVRQSMFFLGILHAGRMVAEPERAGLRGPFFKDYFATVKKLRGWRDGDSFIVNYVAHPMQGAISGFVQIQNDPKGMGQELAMRKTYWNSRLKAMGWAALFSTQFELGPISEASLGNVGLKRRDKVKNPMAWVDLVVTPTVGTAWLVGEDVLDRYVVRRLESIISNRLVRVLVRSFLNPSRSMSNVLRLKYPWHRDSRTLRP